MVQPCPATLHLADPVPGILILEFLRDRILGAVAPILALKAVLLQVLPVPAPRTFSLHSGIKLFCFFGKGKW